MHKQKVGKIGENLVNEILIKKGWVVLITNYRRKGDEIDIIARDNNGVLVFVEVKSLIVNSLSTFDTLSPEDNLTWQKLRKLRRVCQFFARKHANLINEDAGWRIDLIAVELFADGKGVSTIRHYENIG